MRKVVISGIYKIQSKSKPKKIYIGSAVNIHKRKRDHFSNLRNNKHCNPILQNHYNKYGESDLIFSILMVCDKENLIPNEQFFIDAYTVYFNICKKVGSALGRKMSESTKMKISISNKGHKGCVGYKHSPDALKKIGLAAKITNTGRIHTLEHKIKISNGGKKAWILRKIKKINEKNYNRLHIF